MKNSNRRRALVATVILVTCASLAAAHTTPTRSVSLGAERFLRQEQTLHDTPEHNSEYTTMAEPMALPRCGDTRLPEALLTPDPILQSEEDDLRVRVSFIVGADGHVHSPFILDSGGPEQDDLVLRAVQHWRYRPALCNGVPTDSEARIQFRIR
jgi:TonB family protein